MWLRGRFFILDMSEHPETSGKSPEQRKTVHKQQTRHDEGYLQERGGQHGIENRENSTNGRVIRKMSGCREGTGILG